MASLALTQDVVILLEASAHRFQRSSLFGGKRCMEGKGGLVCVGGHGGLLSRLADIEHLF